MLQTLYSKLREGGYVEVSRRPALILFLMPFGGRYGAMWFWAICACFIALTLLWFKFNGWSDTLRHDQLAWG